MKILKCPRCKSENIILNAGGFTGMYECHDCHYVGTLILEVEAEPQKKKAKTKKKKP